MHADLIICNYKDKQEMVCHSETTMGTAEQLQLWCEPTVSKVKSVEWYLVKRRVKEFVQLFEPCVIHL